ncbi:MAG: DegQ family serine endoprotease [Alphaproteobacteria bacterium]|nr:DegQ family serine endoprotease [Alphaproteobacteria bacterium]
MAAPLYGGTVGEAQARPAPESFADLAEELVPSVVNISTTQVRRMSENAPEMPQFPPGSPFEDFFRDFFERQRREGTPRRSTSLGSGFVIDSNGYIVTNNHVIEGADEVRVNFHDNTTATAEVIGRDPKTDLALLKVKTKKKLKPVRWGNSDRIRVGDWVLAIGNPFGFGGTVTAGIVSARQRDINAGPYDDFIQTDASINRGNSGGPLFDLDGAVVGINTAIISPSGGSIGIGFAVPSTLARSVIDQLRKYGRTRRGWLGVRIQTVTDEIAESLGLKEAAGALVASVSEGGPAERAGIKQGDVILELDGKDIPEMRKLPRIVAETEINKQVGVVLWRDGKRKNVKVKIGELEETEAQQASATDNGGSGGSGRGSVQTLGLTLSTITEDLRSNYGLDEEVRGVIVTGVRADSLAAEKGLREGDVIVEAGQKEVSQPEQVRDRVQAAKKEGSKSILLLVQRGSEPPRFLALRIDQS